MRRMLTLDRRVGRLVNSVLAQPSPLWARDEGGRAEDMGGGAVVALQPDHGGARKVLLEAQDVVHLRPAPAVDGFDLRRPHNKCWICCVYVSLIWLYRLAAGSKGGLTSRRARKCARPSATGR